jgi:hypothetical protein
MSENDVWKIKKNILKFILKSSKWSTLKISTNITATCVLPK